MEKKRYVVKNIYVVMDLESGKLITSTENKLQIFEKESRANEFVKLLEDFNNEKRVH